MIVSGKDIVVHRELGEFKPFEGSCPDCGGKWEQDESAKKAMADIFQHLLIITCPECKKSFVLDGGSKYQDGGKTALWIAPFE